MAARHWVGWTDARNTVAGTKRSTTSGGAGGASVPTIADDVFFDVNSWAGTVSITQSVNCLSLNCTWFIGTLTGTFNMICAGSFTLSAGMTYSYTGAISMNQWTGAKTLTFNGKSTANTFLLADPDSTWTLQDTWDNGLSDISFTSWSFNTNWQSILCDAFSISWWLARTLTLGTSNITCQSWNSATTTNLTLNSWSSTIVVQSLSTFQWWNQTYNLVILNNNIQITWSNTFTQLIINGISAQNAGVTIASATQTITNLMINGNSAINRILVSSSWLWTARTLSVSGTISWQYFDLRDINWTGAHGWNISSGIVGESGDAGGNTGITFTTAQTNYRVGNAWVRQNVLKRANTSWGVGGTGRIPLPQDNVVFDASSFTLAWQWVTVNMARIGKSVDSSAVTNTPAISIGQNVEIYWSWVSGGITLPGLFTLTFIGRWTQTITCNGIDFGGAVSINTPWGTVQLLDNFYATTLNWFTLSLSLGTLDANNFDVYVYAFTSLSWVRTLSMGSGTWYINSISGVSWSLISTNLTLNASTSTIKFIGNSTNGKLMQGWGLTYYNVWNATQNTWSLEMSQSANFNDFKIDAGRTQKVSSAATIWVQSISRNGLGTIFITSVTPATQHSRTKLTAGNVVVNDFNIRDSIAVQTNKFYATSSTDAGNNVNWIFWPVPMAWQTNKVFFM